MEVRTYRLDPEMYLRDARKIAFGGSAVLVPVLGGHLAWQAWDAGRTGDELSPFAIGLPIAVFVGVSLLSQVLVAVTGRDFAETFSLAVGRDALRRHVRGWSPVELLRAEVGAIKPRWLGFGVHDRAGALRLFVPRSLVGFEEVRTTLTSWATSADDAAPSAVQQELEALRRMQPFGGVPAATLVPASNVRWLLLLPVLGWVLLGTLYVVIRFLLAP